FKEFPILSETSKLAARVALAVWKLAPDKYVALHNDLMKSNGRVNERRIRKVVESAGLQWDKVLNASKAPDIEAKISDNLALAQKLNINGTPTFIIGEKIFPGLVSLTTMKSAVSTAETSN
ncbi:MAG: DsbA family protein, partial [Hyphomicrobiaceae bacterium]